MVYGQYQVKAEDYFKETEEYMERFWSNNISSYDLENRFPRMNGAYHDGKSVDESFQPEAYEIPEGSRFTSHDVAMLGFISCGVIGADQGSEYERQQKFEAALKEVGGAEQVLQRSNRALRIGARVMQTDSFFTMEPRYLAGYTNGMTTAHQYVKEAVCTNNLPQIADLCKRGLDVVRASFNTADSRNLINMYANTYACGEILKLLDRNPELAEMVGLTPEDRTYYRGMVRVSEIIRQGTIAGDKLAKGENLTAGEKAECERAYSRYVDLSIMKGVEINNYKESKENLERQDEWLQMVQKPDVMAVMQKHDVGNKAVGIMGKITNLAWERDSELIQRLGEADEVGESALFEEMHELVKYGRDMGIIPGYENIKDDISTIIKQVDDNEKEVHDPNTNNRERQKEAREEREARTKANEDARIKKLLGDKFAQAEQYSYGNIHRADLVTVGGETVHEIMAKEYLALGGNPKEFAKYYKEHRDEETERMVKKALDAGRYVELSSVNPDGTLTGQTEQITPLRGQPAPLRLEDEEKVLQSRERVKLINWDGLNQMDINNRVTGTALSHKKLEFLGDWMKENHIQKASDIPDAFGPNPKNFNVDRIALESLSVVAMCAKGYSIEDIGNPDKLKEIKQQTGREVIERIQNQEFEWLGETVIRGQKLLLDQLDEKMKQIDLSDERQLMSPENRYLRFAARSVFDVHQEMSNIKKELLAGAKKVDPQNAEKLIEDFDNRVNTLPMMINQMEEALHAKVQMSNGDNPERTVAMTVPILSGEFGLRQYAQKHAQQPQVPLSRLFQLTDISQIGAYGGIVSSKSKEYQEFIGFLDNPVFVKTVGREFLTGNLSKEIGMDLQIGKKGIDASFRLDGVSQQTRRVIEFGKEIKNCKNVFPQELQRSIEALKDADHFWQRSSEQYKDMQDMVEEMADVMRNFGNPPTYEQLKQIRETSQELRQSVRDYLVYKQEVHSDSRWEKQRIDAAKTLLELSERIVKSGDSMELGFAQIPDLRTQREQYQTKQDKIQEMIVKRREDFGRLKNPDYDKEKLENAIIERMSRRYDKDAPEVYRASGRKMEISGKVKGDDGAVIGIKEQVDALGQLRESILNNREQAIAYTNGMPMSDQNGTALSKEQTSVVLRNMMSRMVAVENIVQERILNGFRPGQESVKPGPQEVAFAKNPTAYLKAVEQTQAFQKAMKDMSPEKMKDILLNDGAIGISQSMKEEAVEVAQLHQEKEPSIQKSVESNPKEIQMEDIKM